MSARKTRLVDCNPALVGTHGEPPGREHYLRFDCPEGHERCEHYVPFTPAADGSIYTPKSGALWTRVGGLDFATLTLQPSIRRIPTRNADGTIVDPCALHINITNGTIVFHGDSK